MGLFSKKNYVCEKCGKEYERRMNFLTGDLCDDCLKELREENERLKKEIAELTESIRGYMWYDIDIKHKTRTIEEKRSIEEHRNIIKERCKNPNGITKSEFANYSLKYHELTDDDAERILNQLLEQAIPVTKGAGYSTGFFVLTKYENVIVDAKDVFAVAFASEGMNVLSEERILCVLFTNDPYIPVFGMLFRAKVGFFEFSKSKKGREGLTELFTGICPNLTYPICDIKQLKKQLKQEGSVKGNLDCKFMLDQITDVSMGRGVFELQCMSDYLSEKTIALLDEMRYCQEVDLNGIIGVGDKLSKGYWSNQINRLKKLNR